MRASPHLWQKLLTIYTLNLKKKKKKLKEPPLTLVPIPSEHIKDLELRSIQTGTRWSDTPTTVQWDDEDLIVVTRLVSHCVIFLGH